MRLQSERDQFREQLEQACRADGHQGVVGYNTVRDGIRGTLIEWLDRGNGVRGTFYPYLG